MSLKVRSSAAPEGKDCTVGVEIDPFPTLPSVPPHEIPFLMAELGQIPSLFAGMGGSPIEGHIEVVIHGGLYETTGEVVVHDQAGDNTVLRTLQAVLKESAAISEKIADRFPEAELRLEVIYKATWHDRK